MKLWRPKFLPDTGQHVGEWVAVKDGRVIAHHAQLRVLVPILRAIGPPAYGTEARYRPGTEEGRDETS